MSLFHRGREEATRRLAVLPYDEFVHGTNSDELLEPLHALEQYYLLLAPEMS